MLLVLAVTGAPFDYAGPLRAGQMLTIRDINGSVRVRARDVRLAETVNGAVDVTVLDATRARLEAKTVNGSIGVTLPSGTGVTLDARTVTGNITADGFTVDRPKYGPGARAYGVAGDGARRVTLNAMNGSIALRR